MKRKYLYRIFGMLFLPALSAACGLEAQEEIFPGNKFRYTELRLEGTLPASGAPPPRRDFPRRL